MDDSVHYLTYDPTAIWNEIMRIHAENGGDTLYPGDTLEYGYRAMQAVVFSAFAGMDNALRMMTRRYAAGEYLDIVGEKSFCNRILASAARAEVVITFRETGNAGELEAGTALTADGMQFYELEEAVEYSGQAENKTAAVICSEAGAAGNMLEAGAKMYMVSPSGAVESIVVAVSATGGRDKEDDEAYRERIGRHGAASVTTGPTAQYEAVAMAVSSDIIDAKTLNIGAGKVGTYLLLADGSDSAAIIQAVYDAQNPTNVRPATDFVVVEEAQVIPYTLNIQYQFDDTVTSSEAIEAAAKAHQVWQENTLGRAFDPYHLISALYGAGATRVVFAEDSSFNENSVVDYTPIEMSQRCKGTISLAVMA